METKKIFQQIPLIMAEVDPIAKNRNNQSQGYKFRGIDDVYAAVQTILAKHKVFPVPTVLESTREERSTKSGGVMTFVIIKMKYTFYAEDGSSFESIVIGEGSDTGDKASNKAMSVAQKYCLIQVLCIPTEDPKDPENDHNEPKAKPQTKLLPQPAPKPSTGVHKQGDDNSPIVTENQLKRLWAIAGKAEMSAPEVKALAEQFGYTGSSKVMPVGYYNKICDHMESIVRSKEAGGAKWITS